jgi:ribonucleoside-diphosphate reductase alpha subunit
MTSPSVHSFMPAIDTEMNVTKRNGELETVSFDKILQRIKRQGKEVGIKVNYTALAMKVIDQLFDGISTTKIDELSAEQCASMASVHYDYNTLAGRIIVSSHQKNTTESFSKVMEELYDFTDKLGKRSPLVSEELIGVVRYYADSLDALCNYSRDFLIDYFGFKTLDRAYLMKINGKSVERPQHMWLRVSIGIHGNKINNVIETYNLMSQKYFTHATPTLFNAGTPRPQLSSCFLIAMENDSIDGIYNTLKDCALISKYAGGIGLHIHNIRATGSHIRGTNGTSNGIVPMLRVFNNTAKYVDQCVHPDTIIYSTQGPIKIKKCVTGETQIFNLTGETEVIKDVLEHVYDGPIREIYVDGAMTPMKITGEHPVYVSKNGTEAPDWVDAKDISVGDQILTVQPKFTKDIASISEKDCYIYGLLLRYGQITNSLYEITGIPNKDIFSYIKDYLNLRLVEFIESNNTISWKPSIHLPFRRSDLYNSLGLSEIHYRWLNLPVEKSRHILEGIFCHDKEFPFDIRRIFPSIKYIAMRMGHIVNLDLIKKPALMATLVNGTIVEPRDGFLRQTVVDVRHTNYTGFLYDLQMEAQHDYLLEYGIVHNGGGKRNGSFAIYLEPWHADIEVFLQMRKNTGDEELKARDLFYALWISDLFMERVKTNGKWTLMCPDECPGLADVYGDAFKTLYESYEQAGKGKSIMNARDLWFRILDAQMETGTPYILYKDAANKKSNQKNLGTIKSSNLCSEIIQYSDDNETAVCNLASIGLPTFVKNDRTFDYEKLHEVAKVVTKNLNNIIDVNYYPTEKTRVSNMRHRPIGIGVQGLADVFFLMGHAFLSDEAREVNRFIFETIYHGALEASCELAESLGTYETFQGSPASQGLLQFDLWGVDPGSDRYEWDCLKEQIKRHGLRNSLLLAPMPTASTSQILGFNECIEPITSNIYSRRTIAGEFIQANKYLMEELIGLGLWNEKIKNNIIANHGSIQQIELIPQEIKDKYKTVWELQMRGLIDMSADRGAFICQSQSLNLWLEDPNYNTLTAMHFYSWQKGLKTGIYYLRRRGKHQAQQFTIEPEKTEHYSSYGQDDEICEMCSS